MSNWAALGINIIVGFLLTPFIISHLGKTGYGIWTLIGSLIGYYGVINLGVDSALVRYAARYTGQGDEKTLNQTASTAMVMFCGTGVLVIVISFLLAAPLASFFQIAPEHVDDFRYAIFVLGFAVGLSFLGNVFGAILKAHERFVAANSAEIVQSLIRAGSIVFFLLLGKGLLGVAYAALIATIIGNVAKYIVCRYFVPHVHINFASAQWRILRMLLVYGGVTTIIFIADTIRISLDSFVIGKWVGITEVGIYGIAAILIRYMVRSIVTGMSVLIPRFATLDGAGESEKLRSLFIQSLSISSLLAFGMATLAIIFGGRFIVMWVGDEFAEAIPVLWILVISYAFALAQNPGIGLLYALNKHHFFAIVTMLEAIANLILSIVLAYKYGIIGVALGTAIPMLVIKIFVQPFYIVHVVKIPILSYIKPIIMYGILFSLTTAISFYTGILEYLDGASLIGYVACFIIVALILVGIYIILYRGTSKKLLITKT